MKRTVAIPALVLAWGAGADPAAGADQASLQRCRALADPAARLACYDELAKVPAAPPAAAPVSAPASAPATPGDAAPRAPVREAAPATAGVRPRAALVESFGLEERVPRDQLDVIESHIPGRFPGWRPNSRIRLANGQVWQVVDDSSVMVERDSPKVVIRRGALGGFFLDIEGDNRSPRVRRVQ